MIHSLAGGGAERVMAGLSTRLSERGHEVHLVTLESPQSDRHAVGDKVLRQVVSPAGAGGGWLGRVQRVKERHRGIRQTVQAIAPDVVLSFCDRMNVDTLLALKASFAAKPLPASRQAVPVVISERSDPAKQTLGPFWNRIRRRVYGRADCAVALTDSAAAHLSEYAAPVVVIPSAVDDPLTLSDRPRACERRTMVAAGRLESEKGFQRLIKAFATATRDAPDWSLTIFGEGSQRVSLENLIHRLELRGRVELPGWHRPLDKPLSEATFFCLSSKYEGFPSVLLEAMSMGVPSLSVDCESGPRVIIDHGRNGLLVEPSVDGLVEGMQRMMDDEEVREKMGAAGMDVVSRFGWTAMTDRYESLLIDMAAGRLAN